MSRGTSCSWSDTPGQDSATQQEPGHSSTCTLCMYEQNSWHQRSEGTHSYIKWILQKNKIHSAYHNCVLWSHGKMAIRCKSNSELIQSGILLELWICWTWSVAKWNFLQQSSVSSHRTEILRRVLFWKNWHSVCKMFCKYFINMTFLCPQTVKLWYR